LIKYFHISIILLFLTSLTACNIGLTKANIIKEWNIDKYKITYSEKTGPVGGAFYQYDVYKNEKHLSYNTSQINNDSCLLRFREENDYYVVFNLCSLKRTILKPDKIMLEFKAIDSITIRPYNSITLTPSGNKYPKPYYDTIIDKDFDSTFTKKLNKKEMKLVINKWNRSNTNGFERLGKTYHYLLTIYSNGTERKIKTLNHYLIENKYWSYKTKENNFFTDLWKNKE
jgi:hypothetical protein